MIFTIIVLVFNIDNESCWITISYEVWICAHPYWFMLACFFVPLMIGQLLFFVVSSAIEKKDDV